VLTHELAHVAQFERLGGIREFLKIYISQCLSQGYEKVSFETEANRNAITALYGNPSDLFWLDPDGHVA
jgi:hypothetical protein